MLQSNNEIDQNVKNPFTLQTFTTTQQLADLAQNQQSVQQMPNENMFASTQVTFFHKVCFVSFGVASFAGWNSIVTAFDFFSLKYPKQQYVDITFYFPFGVMVGDFIAGIATPALAKFTSHKQRIAGSVLIIAILCVVLSIIAVWFNNWAGFWLSMVICLFEGLFECITTHSFVALAGQVDPCLNNLYWTFTGGSGLMMNILRFIVLWAFGSSEESNVNLGTILYFTFAAVIFLISIGFLLIFTGGEYYKAIEEKDKKEQEKIMRQMTTQVTKKDFSNQGVFKKTVQYLAQLISVYKYTGFLPFYLWLTFFQTFLLFPAVSVFKKPKYTVLQDSWAPVTMMAIFNFSDMVGKWLGNYKCLQRLYYIYGLVVIRFSFFVFFLFTAYEIGGELFQNDYFAFVNMFLFSLTNGFVTTTLMYLGPRKTNDPEIRDLINYINSFIMSLGIDFGIIFAIFFASN